MWYLYGAIVYVFIMVVALTIQRESIKDMGTVYLLGFLSTIMWPISIVIVSAILTGTMIKKSFDRK